jgi:competence protein ComEC
MLSGLIFAIVQAVWRRHEKLTLCMPARKAATLCGLTVALAYALLAGFSVPTQRTLYMLAVFAVALWLNRPIAFSKVLAYALVVVVLLDPWAVIAPGFWLSFGAVAMIAFVFNARIGQVHWLKQGMLTQWAVTLGLLPFLLVMFGQASVISPVANAIAIPVISLLVVPFTLLGALLPFDWALHVAHQLMAISMHVLTWLASLPLASWQQPAPPVWSFILAIIGVLYLLMPKGVPLKWLGFLMLLPMLSVSPKPPAFGAMQVTVLDVGQGLATVIQTQNHRLLYDTGAQYSSESDAGGRVVLPFLRGEGIRKLDGIILSHNDNDHTGGAASILAQLPSSWLLSSFAEQSPNIQGVINSPCYAGQTWQWDGVQFEILYPSLQSHQLSTLNDNNLSCVLKVSSAFGSLLLTGDIEKEAEQYLLESQPAEILSVDALVVPHHGSKTSSTPAFVEAVAPTIAISTTDYLNRFKHPKQEVVARYESLGASHYQTDHSGAIIIDFAQAKAIEISQWRGVRQRYWHDLIDGK